MEKENENNRSENEAKIIDQIISLRYLIGTVDPEKEIFELLDQIQYKIENRKSHEYHYCGIAE